ncbi:hypothetical protein OBV_18050 [Oscillibacter valericigenes Sjm18-20]|nr:hypothetical protein OBV_18050 [Oscillibacter valericigenes Sjm18-20]
MLTPDQIAALRDRAAQIADPINDYLIADIARRISEAGQLTSTAAYGVWRAQQLGVSQREMKKRLRKLLKVSHRDLRKLLTQSAEVGYNFDIKNLPQVQAVPFEQNQTMQQIVSAAVKLAQDDFTNLTQTMGLIDPYGKALPLQDAYRSCTDYAFKQVFTGAADYNTAVRRACKNLADKGVQWIDYESGVHTSLEAAVRRNIMGGLGLMQEQITQANHDELGADGWEISAHANSAPDHEPIQGKQYTDAAYTALNDSLVRRIGTLNCGHAAFPIILGVSSPQYTDEELKKFREDNAAGVTYQGRHYTGYEATQMQRKVERAMRTQKRRILADETTGDKDKLTTDQIRLRRLDEEYKRFSKAAGLRTEIERAQVTSFGPRQAARAAAAFEKTLLPKRESSIIPMEKFTEYALNPLKAPDKAIAFSSALGYNIDNASDLVANIRQNLNAFPATSKGNKGYGQLYEVRMKLTGPNGKQAAVITAWIDDANTKETRLVSAYVDKVKGGSE